MQSKIVINILTLVALTGLITFGVLTTLGSIDVHDESSVTTEVNEVDSENNDILGEMQVLESMIFKLTRDGEKLQKTISQNEKRLILVSEELGTLNNKKEALTVEVELLETKKVNLTNVVRELRQNSTEEKNSGSLQPKLNKKEVDKQNKLITDNMRLEANNDELKKQITKLNAQNDLALQNLNETLNDLTDELERTKKRALDNEKVMLNELAEFKIKVNQLVKENENHLDQIETQNELRLKQQQQKKNQLKLSQESKREIDDLKILKSNFEQLDGLRVIFSGNMIYDEAERQIVFEADNSIGIPIFQDDFTGSIAGECGLPIDKKIQNRCSATIIAEFVVENSGLYLRGKEIVEIIKK